jgi:AraC family transcriptional regulator, ethanolamine operon transcriptional activator
MRIEPVEIGQISEYLQQLGWDLHHDQVEPGRFGGIHHNIAIPTNKRVIVANYTRTIYVHGNFPSDKTTFLVPGRETTTRWCGQQLALDTIRVLPPGDTGAMYFPAHSTDTVCSIDHSALEHTIHTLAPHSPLLAPHTRILRFPTPCVERIRSLLENAPFCSPLDLDSLGDQIITSVCLATEEPRGALASRNHWRCVRMVREYVEDHPTDEPINLETLCRITGVGARTLVSAFQAVTGVSPMRFIRNRRLNSARHALAKGRDNDELSVKSVALAHGFWHMGRFANDYRTLFGEHPSATLRGS